VEQSILRTAARITVESHLQAMQSTRPSQYEYEVQAVVEYAFKRHGGARVAYPTIVGSGPNATTLHYQANSRQMLDGELLLIDAATEYEYYAMDLTRTIPVNGRFTSEQRRLYTIVLKAHEAALAQVRPGNRLEDVHAAAVRVITEGLVGVGLLQGHVEDLIADRAYKPYFMHATSHWIGLDIRDCGDYIVNGRSRLLEPGMVFSVEPGLYLQGSQWDQLRAAPNANVGIRIEDTVLVTENGCEVLTKDARTDPDEIEVIMAKGTHSGDD
jgi:Xaa-Pro aminopeptidase